MKYKCRTCGWTGSSLAYDGSIWADEVCPNCYSDCISTIEEDVDDYYDSLGEYE